MSTHYFDGLPAVADGSHSPAVRDISVRIRHLLAVLDECLIGPAESADDQNALAWIVQSLEDIEATITGLTHNENEQLTDRSQLPPVPVYQLTDQGSVLIS